MLRTEVGRRLILAVDLRGKHSYTSLPLSWLPPIVRVRPRWLGSPRALCWIPSRLTDDGLAAPVVVKLNGLSTLRVATTGNSNPNYFMLVPTTGIALTAGRSGNNVAISFPTQSGVIYRVFYRDNLTAGNWVLLTTVIGDGTVKPVNDLATATGRFYTVVAP